MPATAYCQSTRPRLIDISSSKFKLAMHFISDLSVSSRTKFKNRGHYIVIPQQIVSQELFPILLGTLLSCDEVETQLIGLANLLYVDELAE